MTRGEVIRLYRTEKFNIEDGVWREPPLVPQRMEPRRAMRYYTEKLRKAWKEAGYYNEWEEVEKAYKGKIPKRMLNALRKLYEYGKFKG